MAVCLTQQTTLAAPLTMSVRRARKTKLEKQRDTEDVAHATVFSQLLHKNKSIDIDAQLRAVNQCKERAADNGITPTAAAQNKNINIRKFREAQSGGKSQISKKSKNMQRYYAERETTGPEFGKYVLFLSF